MLGPLMLLSPDQGKIYKAERIPPEPEAGRAEATAALPQRAASSTVGNRIAWLTDRLAFVLTRRRTA